MSSLVNRLQEAPNEWRLKSQCESRLSENLISLSGTTSRKLKRIKTKLKLRVNAETQKPTETELKWKQNLNVKFKKKT